MLFLLSSVIQAGLKNLKVDITLVGIKPLGFYSRTVYRNIILQESICGPFAWPCLALFLIPSHHCNRENCRFPPSLQVIRQIPFNMAPVFLKFRKKKKEICRTYSVSLECVVSWQ